MCVCVYSPNNCVPRTFDECNAIADKLKNITDEQVLLLRKHPLYKREYIAPPPMLHLPPLPWWIFIFILFYFYFILFYFYFYFILFYFYFILILIFNKTKEYIHSIRYWFDGMSVAKLVAMFLLVEYIIFFL